MSTLQTFLLAMLLLSTLIILVLQRSRTAGPMANLGVVLGLAVGISGTVLITSWIG